MTKKDPKSSKDKEEDIEAADSKIEEDLDDDNTDEENLDEDLDDKEEEELDEEHSENDIDVDEELEAERKRGDPDPKKAHERIKGKKVEEEEEESEDDKPLTRRELRESEARQAKLASEISASNIARRLIGSGKDADKRTELVVLKWKNRTFPEGMSLAEQVEEAYAITFRKQIIAQRNEALRGLRNKDGIRNDSTTTHHDGNLSPTKAKPKMAPQDIAAIEASGFKWNPKTGQFEKKIKGGMLVKKLGENTKKVSS